MESRSMKNLSRDAAIDALCKCAASVSVLSYQEAIEGYFKLRGLAVPNQQPAQDGLVEALEKVRKCAVVVPSIFPDTPPSVSWIVSELTKILSEMDAALSAIKGDKS